MSSLISNLHPDATNNLETMRRRGWRGGLITPHRAFARLRLSPGRIFESIAMAAVISGAWLALLPRIGWLWAQIFSFWAKRLDLRSEVTLVPQAWGTHIHFMLPTFGLSAGPATGATWWITAAVTAFAFFASFRFPDDSLPWTYLLRSFCLLQATSLGYFAVASARFPHNLPTYTVSMLLFSCILIGLVPVMYAFTYYLLNFSCAQKLLLTMFTVLHLVIFVPHQYLLHVCIVHGSVLFMPLVYFVFGPFLDILAFVGFYAWGMSWNSREPLRT